MANSFTSKDALVVPQWAIDIIGVPHESIARLEVDCDKGDEYKAFISYIAHRGVDVDQEPNKSEIANGDEELNGKEEKANNADREFPGKLSSLAVHEEDSSYSSDSDTVDYTDEENENPDEEAEPKRATIYFGGGSARLMHNEQHICVVHVAHGPAVSDRYNPRMFRSLHIFASGPDVLRSFADTVVNWYQLRKYPVSEKRFGKYDLYIFKDQGCGMEWIYIGKKNSRSLDSIILQDGMLDSIVSDFRSFRNKGTRAWYTQHGKLEICILSSLLLTNTLFQVSLIAEITSSMVS